MGLSRVGSRRVFLEVRAIGPNGIGLVLVLLGAGVIMEYGPTGVEQGRVWSCFAC